MAEDVDRRKQPQHKRNKVRERVSFLERANPQFQKKQLPCHAMPLCSSSTGHTKPPSLPKQSISTESHVGTHLPVAKGEQSPHTTYSFPGGATVTLKAVRFERTSHTAKASVPGQWSKAFPQHDAMPKKNKSVQKLFDKFRCSALMFKLKNQIIGKANKEAVLEGDEDDTKIFKEDFAEDFVTTAEALAKRLLQFNDCIAEGLNVSREVLEQILQQLRKKRILISVLGRHNSGKSTFLNALLANSLLPMNAENETSVKVNIKHDHGIHRCPCPAEQLHEQGAICEACPILLEEVGKKCKSYRGTQAIRLALKQINSAARKPGNKVTAEYEVHGYVSCISEAATPPNWSVLLVDTPGSAEGNKEEIMKEAGSSLTTSSAYVYIMSYSHLDDAKDAAALKHIYFKDKDVFRKNRLLVVVTYFDEYYRACKEYYDSDEEEETLSSDDVKRMVKQLVLNATGNAYACGIPEENVIPICGQWALFAKILCHQPENMEFQSKAQRCLNSYGGGATCKGAALAMKLEEASGIRLVEGRIKQMAQSSFESWVESTKNTFDGFLKQACEKLEGVATSLEEHANGEEEEYKSHKEQQDDLEKKRDEFSHSLSGERSEAYRNLSKIYHKDTKQPIEEGKKTVSGEMNLFKQACVRRCAENYQPHLFQEDVDCFLEKALKSVQTTLNETYSFNSVTKSLRKQMELLGERVASLKTAATDFLGGGLVVTTPTGEAGTGSNEEEAIESIMKQNPTTLEELKKKVQIPPLSKKWLRQITVVLYFVMRIHQGAGLRPDELEKPLKDIREQLENMCSQYFEKNKHQIVMFFYDVYRERAKALLEEFDHIYENRILFRKKVVVEEKERIDWERKEVQTLRAWSAHLKKVGDHLFRRADDYLSPKDTRTPEITKHAPHCDETAPAEKTEKTMTVDSEVSPAKMVSPEEAFATVHVKDQNFKIQVDQQTSIMVVLEGNLQARGLNANEYTIYTNDGEIGKETKSSKLAGNDLFLQHKSTSESAGVQDQFTGRGQQMEDSQISELVHRLSLRRKAEENVKTGGTVAGLLKRISGSFLSKSTEETLPATPASFETDFKEDLMSTCEIVRARLEELQSTYEVMDLVTADLLHDWKQAEEKQISIAVFGNYKSGKSLLLNALAGQRFLPVSRAKPTMVKVRLQHDNLLHTPKDGPLHPESELCEKCPYLMKDTSPEPTELCRGVNNISNALRRTDNSLQLPDMLMETDDHIIHANIPLLSYVPQPWQVHLVDNPGFMELTEVEMERQLKKEVMALSAYIYTVSYNELQDAIGGSAFKLISDQDQAKATSFENRLVVVITHFDRYFNALSKEGMLDEEQVKELVCTSIKNATSRTFPRESVIPICSHWAVIARELIRQPQDEKHKQRALNCFHHCADGRIQNLLTGDESPIIIAQMLEKASGIKYLEKRIIQMSQRAYVESVLTITRNFSAYLGTAVAKLYSYRERAEELVQDHGKRQEDAATIKERIADNKEKIVKLISRTESSTYQDLQSHCEKDIQSLEESLQLKCMELLGWFKQDCARKISADGAFGPPELEEGLDQFLQATSEDIQMISNDAKFESTRRYFYQKVKDVDEKNEQMRQDAHKFCTGKVPRSQQEAPVYADIDKCQMKMPPLRLPQEFKRKVDIPSPGRVFHKEKKYTQLEQLQKPLKQLKSFVNNSLSTYLVGVKPELIELVYGHLCDHVKKQQEAFDEEFSSRMQTRDMEMEEIMKVKEIHEDDVKRLGKWSTHLEKLQKHLDGKCKEILNNTEKN